MSGDTIQEIDLVEVILETTNSLYSSIISSIVQNINPLLDKLIFVDNTITTDSYFEKIFGTSPTNGVLMLTNCLLLAFILYYCIKLIVAPFTGNEVESPSRFILRIIIAAITMNFSLEICNLLINGTNQISDFFLSLGSSIFKKEISFETLISSLNTNGLDNFNAFSLHGILSSILSISSFSLLLSFSLRYILIKLLILASPFAFLCLSTKATEGFLRSWYKSFLSMLLLQIVLSALLIIPYALLKEDSSSLFNKILLIGSISALLKSGQLVKEFLGGIGITSSFSSGVSGIKSIFMR